MTGAYLHLLRCQRNTFALDLLNLKLIEVVLRLEGIARLLQRLRFQLPWETVGLPGSLECYPFTSAQVFPVRQSTRCPISACCSGKRERKADSIVVDNAAVAASASCSATSSKISS